MFLRGRDFDDVFWRLFQETPCDPRDLAWNCCLGIFPVVGFQKHGDACGDEVDGEERHVADTRCIYVPFVLEGTCGKFAGHARVAQFGM